MADEPKESPTIEKPKEAPKTEQPDIKSQVLSELENLGIQSPQQLQNMARASSEAGRLANMVGDLKREIEGLKSRPAPRHDDYEAPGEAVDLGKLIDQRLEGFWTRQVQQQQQAQARYLEQMNEVQGHPKYKELEGVFNKHISNPSVQALVASGQTDYAREFTRLVTTYQDKLIEKLSNQMGEFTSKAKVAPPHMESGTQSPPPEMEDVTQFRQKINKMTNRDNWRGTNEDVENLVSEMLNAPSPKR